MLDIVVGVGAALLVALGVAVLIGPALPRMVRDLVASIRRSRIRPPRAPAPPPEVQDAASRSRELTLPTVHPTTQRAILAASRVAALLRDNGHEAVAAELRNQTRRLALDETRGLNGMRVILRRMERVRIEDEATHLRFRQQVAELRKAVTDRAEQLELLPFP